VRIPPLPGKQTARSCLQLGQELGEGGYLDIERLDEKLAETVAGETPSHARSASGGHVRVIVTDHPALFRF